MKRPFKVLIFISLLAAILSISSPFSIYLGAIPFTFATFIIYIIGGITKRFNGFISIVLYIMIGLIGVPVFSGFRGGLYVILGPTGGFIVGYIPMVLIISLITSIDKNKIYWYFIAMFLGTIVCYLFGTLWYVFITNANIVMAFKICVLPFILFDTLKIIFAVIISYSLNKKINFEEKFGI